MLADFRIAARVLARDRAHSLVSILGLSVGLAFCLLLLGYARYSWSYDEHVPDVDQVYVIKHKQNWELGKGWVAQMPLAAREPAKALPGIADVSGYTNWFPLTVDAVGGLQPLRTLAALPGFTKMLGLQAAQGDLEETLSRPDAFAITEAAAMRLFGTTQVLGKTVTLRLNAHDANVTQARIGAILRTPPPNTTISYECLIGLELNLLPEWAKDEALTGRRGYSGGYLLARLAPGAKVSEVTAALQIMADNSPLAAQVPEVIKAHAGEDRFTEIKLAPLRGEYLDNDTTVNAFSTDVPRGDRRVIAGLTAVGLLLLLLAAVNHVNLATIRVMRRQREVSLRKVLGVGRRRLASYFVVESLLVGLCATGIGMLLAALALPAFSDLVDRDLGGVITAANIAMAAGLGVLVGLLSAIYPAWVALGVRPARMLAGRDGEPAHGRKLRRALAVLQLSLAIGLASVTLAITLQTRHAMTVSPGFDPSQLLVVQLPIGSSALYTEFARAFRTELAQQPAIAGVAVINDPVGEHKETWATDLQREGGDLVFMEIKAVSSDFFDLHGIAPAAGRLFRSGESEEPMTNIVINAEAARVMGFASPELAVGQKVKIREFNLAMGDRTIIGIAPEIRFNSLREPPAPLAYSMLSAGPTLIVRARGSVADAERAIFELWPRHLPNAVFSARPVNEFYADEYAEDARLAQLLAAATLIALLIAACGAFVLATDAVQRRTREIALRKLFGARRAHIGALVACELGAQVLLAAVIALPIAGVAIARYLAPFTERAPLAYVSLAVALCAAALVVAVAAARQGWLAMGMRPAAALRS
jgi:putative ABC transport system permease protein